MLDTPKRPGFDPLALAAKLRENSGAAEPPVARSVPRMDALAVVDLALDSLSRDQGGWQSDGPFLQKSMAFENGWMSYQQPGGGGTFGPDFEIVINVGGENVLTVNWYEESGDEKKVFNFRPGTWILDIQDP